MKEGWKEGRGGGGYRAGFDGKVGDSADDAPELTTITLKVGRKGGRGGGGRTDGRIVI
jgi:hypothetical protein